MPLKLLRQSQITRRLLFFSLSAALGVVVGAATLLLIQMIAWVQWLFYGDASEEKFASIAAGNPWWVVLLAPAVGGLLVGILIHLMRGQRYHGIADVMEACALRGARMDVRSGVGAAVAAAISMGSGAPVGREGPAVHIGASISSWLAEKLNFSRSESLTLLGCGAAAAVTASFNAPIAGVLFALEVVVGYYTMRVFAPIVIASMGSVAVYHAVYGNQAAYQLPQLSLHSLWEMPAFLLLGAFCALFVLIMISLISLLQRFWNWSRLPVWSRAALAGLLIGLVATQHPHILSVGFQAIDMALQESLLPIALFSLLWLKLIGTVLALGSGFAGGVFSPSLFFGAMLGGSYWFGLQSLVPVELSTQAVYSIAGMAGLASAMLGAPISTVLIVFELTHSYQVTVAVMLSAAMASTIMQLSSYTSYFRWQLAQRGINITDGRDQSLLRSRSIRLLIKDEYTPVEDADTIFELEHRMSENRHLVAIATDENGVLLGSAGLRQLVSASIEHSLEHPVADVLFGAELSLSVDTNIVAALQLMADNNLNYLPVTNAAEGKVARFLGVVFRDDLLRTYYETMREARQQEFGVN